MHWGEDVALEKHYVPTRSQRTRSVLSFFAQDGASQTLIYANADLTKATQAERGPRLRRALEDPHRQLAPAPGHGPEGHHPGRARRTRRPRHHLPHPADALTRPEPAHRSTCPPPPGAPCAWTATATYKRPRVVDETTTLSNYPGPVRQLIITGLGRDAATVIITNDRTSTAKQLIERYARRMNIEQRLAESIRVLPHRRPRRVRPPQRRPRRRPHRPRRRRLRRPAPPPHRLPPRHPRHPATPIPVHHRHHHHHRRHHHRPPQPAHLLTRPAAKPTSPTPPSPGGATAPSASNTTDPPQETSNKGPTRCTKIGVSEGRLPARAAAVDRDDPRVAHRVAGRAEDELEQLLQRGHPPRTGSRLTRRQEHSHGSSVPHTFATGKRKRLRAVH